MPDSDRAADLAPGHYVTTDFLRCESCIVVAGPFSTQDEARAHRTALEDAEGRNAYFLEQVRPAKRMTTHTTHVARRPFLDRPHMGRWQPYCDRCGDIGRGERFERDAKAVADHHQQIGGSFKRVSP